MLCLLSLSSNGATNVCLKLSFDSLVQNGVVSHLATHVTCDVTHSHRTQVFIQYIRISQMRVHVQRYFTGVINSTRSIPTIPRRSNTPFTVQRACPSVFLFVSPYRSRQCGFIPNYFLCCFFCSRLSTALHCTVSGARPSIYRFVCLSPKASSQHGVSYSTVCTDHRRFVLCVSVFLSVCLPVCHTVETYMLIYVESLRLSICLFNPTRACYPRHFFVHQCVIRCICSSRMSRDLFASRGPTTVSRSLSSLYDSSCQNHSVCIRLASLLRVAFHNDMYVLIILCRFLTYLVTYLHTSYLYLVTFLLLTYLHTFSNFPTSLNIPNIKYLI